MTTDVKALGSQEREHGVSTVHARLRDALIRGELEAGSILSQVQLAERYGVSRTPLREALRLLEREGLVVSEPRRRVRVAPVSLDDLDQLYAMRITLEALGIRLTVPRLTDSALEHIGELERTMRRHAENEDYDAWHEPHRQFHEAFVSLAGDRIVAEVRALADHAERYRYCYTTELPTAWSQGIIEHRAIYEAARRRDARATAMELARHYARVAINAAALIAPEHDPRTVREALRCTLDVPESNLTQVGEDK